MEYHSSEFCPLTTKSDEDANGSCGRNGHRFELSLVRDFCQCIPCVSEYCISTSGYRKVSNSLPYDFPPHDQLIPIS